MGKLHVIIHVIGTVVTNKLMRKMWSFTGHHSHHKDQKVDAKNPTVTFVQQFLKIVELNKVKAGNDIVLSETHQWSAATLLFITNEHSDGYTIHHCPSPMKLRHARQLPIHLSAKWLASQWLSAAVIMIIYFSPASLLLFPLLFQPKTQQLARGQTTRSIMFYMIAQVLSTTGLVPPGAPMSSQTSLPGRFQTSHFPIKQRAFFTAVSPHSRTDINTLTLTELFATWEWMTKSWIWKREGSGRERR